MSQMEHGISNTVTYTHSKCTRKRKYHFDPYVIDSSQRNMFKQLHQEIKIENPYKASVLSEEPAVRGSQEAAKNDVQGAQNVPEECSVECMQVTELPWQEFKDKMIQHNALFHGSVMHFGKTNVGYIVGVVDGRENDVLNTIRNNITPHIDNIQIVEIKKDQGNIAFLGGYGQSRVICKPIRSGRKIVNVATENYNVFGEGCLQTGLAGTLTILMQDTEHKYYGITAGHVVIEEFDMEMLTKNMKTFPCECYSRTVVCDVVYQEPPRETETKKQVLAQEVFGGVESVDGSFMDCAWFQVDAANKEYLDFQLENIDKPPTVFKDKLVNDTEVCGIKSTVHGVIVEEDSVWWIGDGENKAPVCGLFLVEGKNGRFAMEGDSGKPVHDEDGNVFGVVIGYDTTLAQMFPCGTAICIRLDHMLDYIAKHGGPKLEVARQPEPKSNSYSNTSPPVESSSGAFADSDVKRKSRVHSNTSFSSDTGPSVRGSSGSASSAVADICEKMKSKEDAHTSSSGKTDSSDQSSSGLASGAFANKDGKKKSKEGYSSKHTSVEESEKSRIERNLNDLREALKQAETDQERRMIKEEMRQIEVYKDKRKKTKKQLKK